MLVQEKCLLSGHTFTTLIFVAARLRHIAGNVEFRSSFEGSPQTTIRTQHQEFYKLQLETFHWRPEEFLSLTLSQPLHPPFSL